MRNYMSPSLIFLTENFSTFENLVSIERSIIVDHTLKNKKNVFFTIVYVNFNSTYQIYHQKLILQRYDMSFSALLFVGR